MNQLSTLTKKIFIILGLTFALLIPLSQVETQIASRRDNETLAKNDVARGWGGEVSFISPQLLFSDNRFRPMTADTTLSIESKEKKRGVFHVPVYVATLKTTVNFAKPDLPEKPVANKDKKITEQDYVAVGITPMSAIQSFKAREKTTGKELKAKIIENSIRIYASDMPNQTFFNTDIEIEISARGTGLLTYRSNVVSDRVKMTGNWTKPKYLDAILPTESKLTSDGFEATWTLNSLNPSDDAKAIGLSHLWLDTDYTMIERAVKYGILFIALTFLLIFIVEFIGKVKIHPLQYGLIGLSISMFYLLLLAFSEKTGFDIAYAIASLAVIGLIVFYVHGFMKEKKFVKMILGEQITLSGFFYILLSLEENAFLVGTIGLFIALALFMAVTRRFDWYAGGFKLPNAGEGSNEIP